MPAYDDLAYFVRWNLKLKTIPNGVIVRVNKKRPDIEEYVRQQKIWLLAESQKPNADKNYAKLYYMIPDVDGAGSSKDTKWGTFLADVLHPWLKKNPKQPEVSAKGEVRSR